LIELGIDKPKEVEGMRRYRRIKLSVLFASCICLLPILSAKAKITAAEEWVDVPVLVNVIDASDTSNIDDAIKKANKILAQAHIRLIVTDTNNVNVGNNDDNLTLAERGETRSEGQKELDKTCGAGKGIKIDVVTNCDTADASTNGVSVHRNPVVIVEPDDPNTMGNVIAHEIGHFLTIEHHSTDPNNLMYKSTPRGIKLDSNQINEIFPNAKKRGRAYFIVPRTLGPVMIPPGIDYSIDAHGGILDGFYDQEIYDSYGSGVLSPDDPTTTYADLREITMFCDDPLDPNSNIKLEIQLGGTRPDDFAVDSFFDVFFFIDPEKDPIGVIMIDVPADGPPTGIWVQDPEGEGPGIYIEPPPIIHRNQEFDVKRSPAIVNDSLEVTVSTELVALHLVSTEPILVGIHSYTYDYRIPDQEPIMIDDFTYLFEFGLMPPCTCPRISFAPFGVLGCGFTGEVDIKLDDSLIGSTPAGPDGTFIYLWDPAILDPGLHSVIATGYGCGFRGNYATGYFNYWPGGEITGDLNMDSKVDFYDLAEFARNWLRGP